MARPPSIEEGKLIDVLVSVFRDKGFDGTAIADLAAATGLQGASLYHRFPDGKEEMADASRRAGRPPEAASRAANDAFVRIEGALVLARVTGGTNAFAEAVAALPALLVPESGAA
ncbi:helix-turn-helix domain-containing protein [Pseudonocardia sp. N23]|uniref:helix-turn-helix domain-containing protein n=1 Tax=Pseudonocardia sp. N23 TaxID=1987376 RepID=UPI000BFE8214|nr:TetR/AcrR family transcriptional regulator [Pseudonocardia sp. N23]GAY11436.1 hypothetical protein TOK_5946 [Pseudonocardia sp. N23]